MPAEPGTDRAMRAIAGFRLVTGDLARLRRFYAETLGLSVDGPEHAIDAQEMAQLGLTGTGVRQSLRLGEQEVAIDRFSDPARPYPGGNAASLWFQHLAIVVTDIAASWERVRDAAAITLDGPQQLPASSGGVTAFKFRDPDGHPLELLQFPPGGMPAPWQGRSSAAGVIGIGIDHSAISVADPDASVAFYAELGLSPGKRSLNHGTEQQRLDGLPDVDVAVVPLQPAHGTPHLELLGYRTPRGAAAQALRANDVAATRIVWRGTAGTLLADPDWHLHQFTAFDGGEG